jgi:hypothetical protein
MGGVIDEGDLGGRKMQQVQVNVEDGALALCNVNEKPVQMGVEAGETFTKHVVTIEVKLQKTIEMIVEQKHLALVLVPKQENEDEHVIGNVDIDACDIELNLQSITPPILSI